MSAFRILITDDDPDLLFTLRTQLEADGFEVLSAASGEAALAAAEKGLPHLAILDLLMPGMDGFEFAERFREKEAARGVPIIVWTSKDLTDADRRRLRETAQGVVMKRGGTAEDLIEELRACGVRDGR